MRLSEWNRMTPELPAQLRDELLDDFYSECDELLGGIRTCLTQLEGACRNERTDPVTLEALYRNVHSFKGISAIVGLHAAQELAHAAEGLLRGLCRAETLLAPANLDLLAATTQRLEQIVTAHRLRQTLPAMDDLVRQLNVYGERKNVTVSVPAAAPRLRPSAGPSGCRGYRRSRAARSRARSRLPRPAAVPTRRRA